MKRLLIAMAMIAAVVSVYGLRSLGTVATAPAKAMTDAERIDSLLDEMYTADLDALEPLAVQRFVIPGAGVDVMRVKLSETYNVYGVGTDTVQLSGWIAVTHDSARPARGESSATWGTAISPTEFVGLELRGESKLFGPVYVSLDRSKPSVGMVGKLEVPFAARVGLDLAYRDYRRPAPDAPAIETRATGAGFSKQSLPRTAQTGALTPEQAQVQSTLRGMWAQIDARDAEGMLTFYSKAAGTVFFNQSYPGGRTTSAEDYVRALAEIFSRIESIKVLPNDDWRILVSGPVALVAVTGRNDVVDKEGRRGSSAWAYTAELQRPSGTPGWSITHDHLSFVNSPGFVGADALAACAASLSVAVHMPKLDLRMATRYPVQWYSEVSTIPPVGHEASVSLMASPLVSGGREVATLTHGAVTFREVVKHVALAGSTSLPVAN